MAERNNDDISPERSKNNINTDTIEFSDEEESMVPDLGVENIRIAPKKVQNAENHSSSTGTSDTPRREENPFSFKHFLKQDSSNYQSQGARPKVYATAHSLDLNHGIPNENHQPSRLAPEFSSALPDFVQDHLVIEQCYLGTDASPQDIAVDLNNLPDFTPSRNCSRWQDSSKPNDRRNTSTPTNLPLDLPTRPRVGFPLDLPLTESNAGGSRSCPQSSEVGVSKSLPDFLSDGAVYSQSEDNTVGQSPEREIDRLRRELEVCRRQLAEQSRRTDHLQRQLDISKSNEHEYAHNLTKAMEQVEKNLDLSNRRAMSAEHTVAKLKQEVRQLNAEIVHLQKENRSLRCEDGAIGGPNIVPNVEPQVTRFAQDLRSAASTAEISLRQLLSGVDNLRIMASSLESIYRIEERSDQFLSDVDEDTGPAL